MVNFRINPKTTAILVFDMINDFVHDKGEFSAPGSHNTLPKVKSFLDFCRSKQIPIIYANQVHRLDGSDMGILADIWPRLKEGKGLIEGTKGVDVIEAIKPQPGDAIVWKHRYSAFFATDLEMILRNKSIDTLVLIGGTMNTGCEPTAIDAMNRDIKVILPTDCNTFRALPDVGWGPASREEIEKVVYSLLSTAVGRVVTTNELITELSVDGSDLRN